MIGCQRFGGGSVRSIASPRSARVTSRARSKRGDVIVNVTVATTHGKKRLTVGLSILGMLFLASARYWIKCVHVA